MTLLVITFHWFNNTHPMHTSSAYNHTSYYRYSKFFARFILNKLKEMIFFDHSILTTMYACLYFKEFHCILWNLCEVTASMKQGLTSWWLLLDQIEQWMPQLPTYSSLPTICKKKLVSWKLHLNEDIQRTKWWHHHFVQVFYFCLHMNMQSSL